MHVANSYPNFSRDIPFRHSTRTHTYIHKTNALTDLKFKFRASRPFNRGERNGYNKVQKAQNTYILKRYVRLILSNISHFYE